MCSMPFTATYGAILITQTYFCPYHPIHGIGKYLKDSFDRKPKPGMILKASKKYDSKIN